VYGQTASGAMIWLDDFFLHNKKGEPMGKMKQPDDPGAMTALHITTSSAQCSGGLQFF